MRITEVSDVGKASESYDCVYRSLVNIRQTWLSLFKYSRCPSCGDGLGLSWSCISCQDARRSAPLASSHSL